MPKVLESNGYKVFIYTHDHLPRHVHVWRGEVEIIINIDTLEIIWISPRARPRMIKQAWELVADNQEFLQGEWERIKPIP